MLEEIKKILKDNPETSCYAIAKIMGKTPTAPNVFKNYWRAKYELLLEKYELLLEEVQQGQCVLEANEVSNTRIPPEEAAPEEPTYQEDMPSQWTDKEGQVYVKGKQSGTWRVYPNGLEFGSWKDIDEHKVRARYTTEILMDY